MNIRVSVVLGIGCLVAWSAVDVLAGRGGGFRGGGGFSRGGGGISRGGGYSGRFSRGGGYSRGSVNRTPSFSQPSYSRPSSRPSIGNRPSGSISRPSQLPSTGSRPSIGNRPSQLPSTGSRPNIGNRPSQLPSTGSRPNIGNRPSQLPSTGVRPEIRDRLPTQLPSRGTRPDIGSQRPIVSTRPDGGRFGTGNRPSTLPALGGAAVGAGIANRIGDRPAATLPGLGERRPAIGQLPAAERRDQLASRLRGDGPLRDGIERPARLPNRDWNEVRNDWRDHRNDIRDDWRDYRDDVRDDWQDWRDDRYPWHRRWYWGYATGYWNRWDYLWDDYPAAAAVGLTWWGVNSLSYGFGYSNYYNPYYVDAGGYSYAEPVVTTISVPVEGEPATTYIEPPQESLDKFTQAQNAFERGSYDEALALVDEAAVEWPTDPVLHEFRSLVLFALHRYSESAAAIHAVLAVGPGWDWKTLSSLYPNVEVYTSQLRALETSCKERPEAADLRFLLGYHYLALGHNETALKAFQEVCEHQPKDEVSASLVRSLSPRETDNTSTAPETETPKPVPSADIVGTWQADGKDSSKFTMVLDQDGNFVWSFTKDSREDEVKGVYSIEGNVLAMEPATGGVLLAEITVESSGSLHFQMVGSDGNDSDLNFERSAE